jgi:TetR/AcrR family transcriptional regulator, mexJK operon transcriptional repressor
LLSKASAQKKQDDILNAARELFLERGYDAVSLDDIVERVGGSKTTLYSYYGGKEGLFGAMVRQVCHDKLGALLAMDVTNLDPKAGLHAIGQQFVTAISNNEGRAVFRAMVAEAQRFPELAQTFYSAGPEAAIGALRRNIEHWQKKGLLKRGDAEMLAVQFLGLMMGSFHIKSLLGIMDPLTEKQIKTWVERGTNVFLLGLLPRSN